MNQFFAELKDAPENPGLALCTATVLFVLSQDRLNMDMDRDSLELMLNLLDTDSRIKDALDASGKNIFQHLQISEIETFMTILQGHPFPTANFRMAIIDRLSLLFNQYEIVILSKDYDI